MIGFLVLILLFVFSVLRPLLHEIEKQDSLLLNATLSSNKSNYVSEEWLQGLLLQNTSAESQKAAQHGQTHTAPVEPDWSLVLGTFKHYKDEQFNELLIAVGVPFFVRSLILNASPTVTIERVFQGDDYYYDLYDYDYDYPDEVFERVDSEGGGDGGGGGGGSEDKVYQIVLTTTSYVSRIQRFRPGRPFSMKDFDGTVSKNTYTFRGPTTIFHYKEKERGTTTIIYNFDQAGLNTTIISARTGIQARRQFKRVVGS